MCLLNVPLTYSVKQNSTWEDIKFAKLTSYQKMLNRLSLTKDSICFHPQLAGESKQSCLSLTHICTSQITETITGILEFKDDFPT